MTRSEACVLFSVGQTLIVPVERRHRRVVVEREGVDRPSEYPIAVTVPRTDPFLASFRTPVDGSITFTDDYLVEEALEKLRSVLRFPRFHVLFDEILRPLSVHSDGGWR